MRAVCDTYCDEQSEARNARVRKSVGERSESVGKRECGTAKFNNVILSVRDEVQSPKTRSELQRDSETRG
jgi:hypothetical protein